MNRLKLLVARLAAAIHRALAPKPRDPMRCENCGTWLTPDEKARDHTWCEDCHAWWSHR